MKNVAIAKAAIPLLTTQVLCSAKPISGMILNIIFVSLTTYTMVIQLHIQIFCLEVFRQAARQSILLSM